MKRNIVTLLGIAFVVAIAATGIFYGLVVGKLRAVGEIPRGQQIVVAARDLGRGVTLKPEDLKLLTWASPELPKGVLTSTEEVQGKTVHIPITESEPVTAEKLGLDGRGGGAGIPKGRRAVSVRVSESSGVAALLRSGQRVDVQVVGNGTGEGVTLRTILQDIEVHSVQLVEPSGRAGPPVVTLLATPRQADQLALADTGAKVRLLLRNPDDRDEGPRGGMTVAQLFQGPSGAGKVQVAAAKPGPVPPGVTAVLPAPAASRVQFSVRVVGADPKALGELARLGMPRKPELMQVAPIPLDGEPEQVMAGLVQQRKLDVLSMARLTVSDRREVSMAAGGQAVSPPGESGIRLHLTPTLESGQKLRVRVEPELSASRSAGTASRKIVTEVDVQDGQSFLITGWTEPGPESASLVAQIFGDQYRGTRNHELAVLVTAQLLRPVETAALTKGK